jgi:hypothetical protein
VLALFNSKSKNMFVSVSSTTTNYSVTSTISTGSGVYEDDVYYIHLKYDDDYEDKEAIKRDEKEWIMTGWINPRKISLPKFNVILPKRKIIRNALPRKVRECHS